MGKKNCSAMLNDSKSLLKNLGRLSENSEGGNVSVALDSVHYKKYLLLKSMDPDCVSESVLSGLVAGQIDQKFVAQKERLVQLTELVNSIG